MRSLLLTVSTFSVLPVPGRWLPDFGRRTGAAALRGLPLLGAGLGAVAAVGGLVFWRGYEHGSPLLGAAVTVVLLALLTRGLHLDGLADLADGLGSGRPAETALEIMRRSDIGPFGVAAVVGALVLQTAALATAYAGLTRPQGVLVAALAAATGRYAAFDAGRVGVPPARPGGFGALVAGSASAVARAGVALLGLVVGTGLSLVAGVSPAGAVALGGAAVLGTGAGRLLSRHAVRRLGGTTGDVFGALIEVTTTVTLLALAAATAWEVLP